MYLLKMQIAIVLIIVLVLYTIWIYNYILILWIFTGTTTNEIMANFADVCILYIFENYYAVFNSLINKHFFSSYRL